MKLSLGIIIALLIGYALARYFPGPGNMIGLP
jgi:hypothetical protein